MVLPGFVGTEGFPATELGEKALTRWIVSNPERVAEAIDETGPRGKAERYVPVHTRSPRSPASSPRLVRRILTGGAASGLTTKTAAKDDRPPGAIAALRRKNGQRARAVGRWGRHRLDVPGSAGSTAASRSRRHLPASPRKAGSLEETLEAICNVIVPELADFCMIDVIEDERVRRVAVQAGRPRRRGEAAQQARGPRCRRRCQRGAASAGAALLRTVSREDLRELAADEEDLEFLRGLGVRSAITVALKARGRVTGTLTVGVGPSGRRYRRADAHFAWILSGRVALALDNCGLFADLERAERARAEIAETLQRGLLPPPLPHIPGWSVAAMYRPAGAENEVGGDFYDVFRIADGWMLVIGDVTGRGARAAAVTALARYTLRTAAALTGDPVMALRDAQPRAASPAATSLCSVVALAIGEDPAEPVRLAVAGHPPPLLVDGEEVPRSPPPTPCSVPSPTAAGRSPTALEPGQQLVVVTDGVTEARGRPSASARRGCGRAGGRHRSRQVVQRVEGALQEFTGGVLDDDIAMLVSPRADSASTARACSRGRNG